MNFLKVLFPAIVVLLLLTTAWGRTGNNAEDITNEEGYALSSQSS